MADQGLLLSATGHDTLPENYIRPESERPGLAHVITDADDPVVDLGSPDKPQLISQVANACQSYGFFQVVNHGVSLKLMMAVAWYYFFHLPPEEKAKLYSDDPLKKMRLPTSFNVIKETIHNWRDYLRLHCYPRDEFDPNWPSNPLSFKIFLQSVVRCLRIGFLRFLPRNNTIARVIDEIFEGITVGGDVFPGSTLSDHVLQFNNIAQISTIPLIPALPNDVAKHCLAFIPRRNFPILGEVGKSWRSFIPSKEFLDLRKKVGNTEEWIFTLVRDSGGYDTNARVRWEIWGGEGEIIKELSPMPGPFKSGFQSTMLNSKLLVIGGERCNTVAKDVYQYDPWTNKWDVLAKLNIGRCHFACAQVNGKIYVAGGIGANKNVLSSVEVYDPDRDMWLLIEGLHHPVWGCLGCSLEGELYVFGGNLDLNFNPFSMVQVYSPKSGSWRTMTSDYNITLSPAVVLEQRLFSLVLMDPTNKLAMFDPAADTWTMVELPDEIRIASLSSIGIFGGKVLIFPFQPKNAVAYDPERLEWSMSPFPPPSRLCSLSHADEA